MALIRALAALALLLPLVVPVAGSAETVPVLVERVDAEPLTADVDQAARVSFTLFNLNPDNDFYVSLAASHVAGWQAEFTANRFFLQPRETREVALVVLPETEPRAHAVFTITFSLVDGRSGQVTKVEETVEVRSSAPPLVLGFFTNPLPPPLDNAYGTFLLDAVFWAAVGLVVLLLGDALVRILTTRAPNQVTREILTKFRRPAFYFVFLLGLSRSFAIIPENALTRFISGVFFALAVAIFGFYLLYRVLDAGLLYYQTTIAPRTDTKVDDVLVPVLRKVGLVAIYVAGTVVGLRAIGWDPTLVFAGAGIAGLVIAFAAQDTFSNLFSGLFLMVDRSFKEGDIIQLETGENAVVQNVGLRTTRLYNWKTHETIVVPNNQLATRRIVNHSGPDPRFWDVIAVGASYDSDPAHVERTLLEVVRAHPGVLRGGEWEPSVAFTNFGDSSLDFRLRFAVEEYRISRAVASDLRFAIYDAFERENIEIPFPQRTLWLKQGVDPPRRRSRMPRAKDDPGDASRE